MKKARIRSAVPLTDAEKSAIISVLKLTPADECHFHTDASVIAGLAVEIDGVAVDLTIKRQLAEIAQEN